MNGRIGSAVGFVAIIVSLPLGLLGSAEDGGCGEGYPYVEVNAHGLMCEATGGRYSEWVTVDYPHSQWPMTHWPASCRTDGVQIEQGHRACQCPADRPNWVDGRGCTNCGQGFCSGKATDCSYGYNVGQQMTNTWACMSQRGCSLKTSTNGGYSTYTCTGIAQDCPSFSRQEDCQKQRGCIWRGANGSYDSTWNPYTPFGSYSPYTSYGTYSPYGYGTGGYGYGTGYGTGGYGYGTGYGTGGYGYGTGYGYTCGTGYGCGNFIY